jgi:hypothetical protein
MLSAALYPAAVFNFENIAIFPFWAAMIALPDNKVTKAVMGSYAVPILLGRGLSLYSSRGCQIVYVGHTGCRQLNGVLTCVKKSGIQPCCWASRTSTSRGGPSRTRASWKRSARWGAVQVGFNRHVALESAWFQALHLKCDILLTNFAFPNSTRTALQHGPARPRRARQGVLVRVVHGGGVGALHRHGLVRRAVDIPGLEEKRRLRGGGGLQERCCIRTS